MIMFDIVFKIGIRTVEPFVEFSSESNEPVCIALYGLSRNRQVCYCNRVVKEENHLVFEVAGEEMRIPVPDTAFVKLEIIDPIPEVDKKFQPIWYPPSESETTEEHDRDEEETPIFWFHVFRVSNSAFLGTVSGTQETLGSEMTLTLHGYRSINLVSFRIINGAGKYGDPLTFQQVLDAPPSRSFVVYVHAIDADVLRVKDRVASTEGLPQACCDLICNALEMDVALDRAPFRRLVLVALSGGFDLRLLPIVGLDPLSCDKVIMNLWNAAREVPLSVVLPKLAELKVGFKTNRLFGKSEAAAWSGFWAPLFAFAFTEPALQYEAEWKTTNLFPELESRRMDAAVSLELYSKRIPVLLVEACAEEIPPGSVPKDYSKLLEVMSLCCREQANQFVRNRRNPEHARCYGMFIGASGAQLCVASPAVTTLSNGRKQIHAVITKYPHWYVDLFRGLVWDPNCSLPCCQRLFSPQFESVWPANTPVPSGSVALSTTESGPQPRSKEVKANLEIHGFALQALWYFLRKGIYKAADDIMNVESISPESAAAHDPASYLSSIITEARTTKTSETPREKRVTNLRRSQANVPQRPPGDGPATFLIRKLTDQAEFDLYCELSDEYPECFPRLLSYNVIEEGEDQFIEYLFERMHPTIMSNGGLNRILFSAPGARTAEDHARIRSARALKFGLDIAVGLYVLHAKKGYLHGDIKPWNIMYSPVYKNWKLIDFNRAVRIEEAARKPMRLGSEGYMAPEVIMSRSCSTASDVYAFGMTLSTCILCMLQFPSDETRAWDLAYEEMVKMMIDEDPLRRPSVAQCICLLLNGIRAIDPVTTASIFPDFIENEAPRILSSEGIPVDYLGPAECLALMKESIGIDTTMDYELGDVGFSDISTDEDDEGELVKSRPLVTSSTELNPMETSEI